VLESGILSCKAIQHKCFSRDAITNIVE
jgi:hypothetical protein